LKDESSNIETKECDPKDRHLVYQSNDLIEALYQISLTAKKLMVCAISQIHPDDDDFKFYMIPIDKFKLLAEIKSKADYYPILVQYADELNAKRLDIHHPSGKGTYRVSLIGDTWYDRKNQMVGFNFSKILKPHLLRLKETGRFTRYRLGNVMKLRSAYSIRLYELLKQYENTLTKKRTFELDELRKKVGVPDGKLKTYQTFKVRVIEVAKKELPEKTDIGFTYKPIKKGRSVKWLEFTIKPRQKAFVSDGKGRDIDTADIPLMMDIPAEIIQHIPEQWRTHHDVLRDVSAYIESHGEAYVLKNVAYAASKKPANFAAYLGNSFKQNYGAEYSPNQQSLFPDLDDTPVIEPGMVVTYKGQEYTIDEALCIYPESGGCMPGGQIVQGIKDDKIKIKMDE
jgi:hypothetical protein